jgi:hypothetical protein
MRRPLLRRRKIRTEPALDCPCPLGYGPAPAVLAQVAQLVEHATENRSVGGSIPPLGTTAVRGLLLSTASGSFSPTFPLHPRSGTFRHGLFTIEARHGSRGKALLFRPLV